MIGCEAFTSAYIDDVLVFSDNENEYKIHLRKVFECLSHHHLRIKPKKCEFFQTRISFLGHVLCNGQISVEHSKVETFDKWRGPLTTVHQSATVFRTCILLLACSYSSFSATAAPLSAITHKDSRVIWTDEAQNTLDTIIQLLKHAPLLMVWDSKRETQVTTNASLVGIGALLEQLDETWIINRNLLHIGAKNSSPHKLAIILLIENG